jgi:uncharacterized protein
MGKLQVTTVYFDEAGPGNTDDTLMLVRERAKLLNIHTILVATTSGTTGMQVAEMLPDHHVVAVTHSTGFQNPFVSEHDPEMCRRIEAAGAHVLTTTHALGGVGRAVRKKLGTYQIDEVMAFTLRCFGQGMKVAAEITLMASDSGMVPDNSPLIAIGGSGRGADTAAILLPTHAQTFFDLRFLEIICMPAPGHPQFMPGQHR